MTVLADILKRQIAAHGPITLADYMNACLLHPEHGYYTTRQALGVDGDFTTAPEITQMFGEVLGLWMAQVWLDQGAPASFTLLEMGPGRGTLMADALRATKAVPGFHDAAHITLLEASPKMKTAQEQTLAGHSVSWIDTLEALSDQPVFAFANEFFDALPIRQFLRTDEGWAERMIGVADGALAFGLAQSVPRQELESRHSLTNTGDLVETCAPAQTIALDLGQRIETQGGALLICDYGDGQTTGDTFQALQAHTKVDPLAEPGAADLTAHVDFDALAKASPSAHTTITTQGVFLERLGITPRAQTLARNLQGSALEAHIAAHRRLTHPMEMGTLFKAMALYPTTAPAPPGFDT